MTKRLALFLLVIFNSALIQPALADKTESLVKQTLNGEHRARVNKLRDTSRHPAETLAFFGLKSHFTVVEIWPGRNGWYTEILAPVLMNDGKFFAAQFDPSSKVEYFKDSFKQFKTKVESAPRIYEKMVITVLQPPEYLDIAPPESADMVLTFRNVHNWMRNAQASNVFEAMFRALKPGGILGVVEHRAPADKPQDPKAVSGYVREDYVIDLATRAGFRLSEKSEINANPRDTKDHPKGVWTLPPTLRLENQDREKYLAVGESDRMTLKFLKPK